jgi:hypothetical protein
MIAPTQETVMLTENEILELQRRADAGDLEAKQRLLALLAAVLEEIAS